MITSRVGRVPIVIPQGVTIDIQQAVLTAKGPKGSLALTLHPFITVEQIDGRLQLKLNQGQSLASSNRSAKQIADKRVIKKERKVYKAIAGTTWANLKNLCDGVSQGFERKLILVGLGYRAQLTGKKILLNLGYSNPIEFIIPDNIAIVIPSPTEIIIKGIQNVLVGQVAARIRSLRPPEPYKGKGIRYANEEIELKETTKK